MDRRSFIRSAVGASALGAGMLRSPTAFAAPAHPGPGPYGPLGPPDANGVRVPAGFSARIVAVTGLPVGALHGAPIGYVWHGFPDGGACFPTDDGGWVYVSNSEMSNGAGGVGALRFSAEGAVVDAYSILNGTSVNCAGGPTPWNTWLSCEEVDDGRVWECNPFEPGQGVVRPAMGAFAHEAVAVDPVHKQLYLTEDAGKSGFYRFTPTAYPDLSSGVLELAVCESPAGGATRWVKVPDPSAASGRTALQVPGANTFDGGEGCWYDAGFVYHSTKNDNKIWAYDTAAQSMMVLYDVKDHAESPLVPVQGETSVVDNITVAPSGDVLVAEDGGNLEICIITADTREVAPIMRLEGENHRGSEIAGPAFSPDGKRLYFSSQRGNPTPGLTLPGQNVGSGFGVTYEMTGPFRTGRVGVAALGVSGAATPMNPADQQRARRVAGESLPATGGDQHLPLGLGMLVVAGALGLRARQRRTT